MYIYISYISYIHIYIYIYIYIYIHILYIYIYIHLDFVSATKIDGTQPIFQYSELLFFKINLHFSTSN